MTFTVDTSGQTRFQEVTCGSNDYAYGGGAWIEGPNSLTVITESAPSGDLHSWYVEGASSDLVSSHTVHAYALCGPSRLTMTTSS